MWQASFLVLDNAYQVASLSAEVVLQKGYHLLQAPVEDTGHQVWSVCRCLSGQQCTGSRVSNVSLQFIVGGWKECQSSCAVRQRRGGTLLTLFSKQFLLCLMHDDLWLPRLSNVLLTFAARLVCRVAITKTVINLLACCVVSSTHVRSSDSVLVHV